MKKSETEKTAVFYARQIHPSQTSRAGSWFRKISGSHFLIKTMNGLPSPLSLAGECGYRFAFQLFRDLIVSEAFLAQTAYHVEDIVSGGNILVSLLLDFRLLVFRFLVFRFRLLVFRFRLLVFRFRLLLFRFRFLVFRFRFRRFRLDNFGLRRFRRRNLVVAQTDFRNLRNVQARRGK
jgi:hypothetical protein